MPCVCRFFGISIYFYFSEHSPPHFHAFYGGDEAIYEIQTLRVYAGGLPRRAHNLVLEWADQHRLELMDCWNTATANGTLKQIEPLR
ncbi:MAG: DUF4160 domain-containing protein [Acidobacteria bacterium]|nr:DUF4160 domain-containing protein [Acidobacteriota bacterium]MBK9526896.1 DUF4160 domain-containing protein [Acidobacteriota bacterium]MBP7476349.1 DUF4160 domain-containing protein [Pyrinomonadaceae bacterium]MBP9109178.1 DUF4160 domain-containing protein [Pyrinomonadaceae bacterium]